MGRKPKHQVPKQKITLTLDPDLIHRAQVWAAIERRSVSEMVEESLGNAIDALESERGKLPQGGK